MKKKIIIANLKLNGNLKYIKKYIEQLNKYINNKIYKILIAPPMLYLYFANKIITTKNIKLVSQNIDKNLSGSYTGDISGKMLKDINVKYVIIGHSERKKYHKENNKIILKKIIASKKSNLIPIICIGENIKEYIKKKSKKICKKQIKYIIKNKNIKILNNSIIAYEPIWAIGTGKNANIEHIEKINKYIIKYINSKNKNIMKNIKIIYGGSVNNENIYNIIKNPYIDGLLIGKYSWKVKNFINLLNIINNLK